MNLQDNISATNILNKEPAAYSISAEILLTVMQNNIKMGFENYAEIISKLKLIKNHSERSAYLETKLFELREIITNQKPVLKSFLIAFPSDSEKIYDLIISPLANLREFLEEKIALIEEFHSGKAKKNSAKAKHSTELPLHNSALEELKAYIDQTVGSAIQNTPEPPKADNEVFLRRSDVAKLFSISIVTVSEWSKSGRLKSYRINSRVFFKKDEVLAAMKERGKRG